ncbi:MAG: replicative DNA helicase [Peptostreptococcaceae bacterium]|nr:replicative DNA helicase [Peptostreptococcaceae bacterium]
MDYLGRIPPHNIDAEQSVLGAMLLDREAVISVTEKLRDEHFYKENHKEIFRAMLDLYGRNEPVDLVTVSEELKKAGILEEAGGVSYLTDLSNAVPITANARYYADIIEEKAILRQLIDAGKVIVDKGYASSDVKMLMDEAERRIFEISQKKSTQAFAIVKDVLQNTLDYMELLAGSESGYTGLPTGFHDIDKMTSGLQKSDLVLIAARPSMGKTALGINIAQSIAVKSDKSVALFSLEMSKEQLVQRMLSSQAHVEITKIRTGKLTEEEWIKVAGATVPLGKAKIYIDDTPGITVMEIKAKARRLKMESGLDLVLIDYLQLMSSDSRSESRQQEISAISRGLKGLARELECPIIALSQLSRAPEQRSDHRPILSDLRDSGAIEQDADIVMFLYRDEYYHEDSDKKNIGEIIIAKQRNGPTGTVHLAWLGKYTKFGNIQRTV